MIRVRLFWLHPTPVTIQISDCCKLCVLNACVFYLGFSMIHHISNNLVTSAGFSRRLLSKRGILIDIYNTRSRAITCKFTSLTLFTNPKGTVISLLLQVKALPSLFSKIMVYVLLRWVSWPCIRSIGLELLRSTLSAFLQCHECLIISLFMVLVLSFFVDLVPCTQIYNRYRCTSKVRQLLQQNHNTKLEQYTKHTLEGTDRK